MAIVPRKFIKIGFFILLMLSFFLIFQFIHSHDLNISIEGLKSKIDSYGIWAPVAFIVMYQIRPLFFLPATITSTAAALIWGWEALTYIIIADSLCATWQFLGARYFAHGFAQKIIKNRMDRVNRLVEKRAFITVFIVRLVPNIVLDLQNISFGLTKVKYVTYISATILGLLPGKFLIIYFIHSLTNMESGSLNMFKLLILFFLFIVVYGFLIFNKNLRKA